MVWRRFVCRPGGTQAKVLITIYNPQRRQRLQLVSALNKQI